MADELDQVTKIICSVGKVAELSPDQDFYEAGVSSISALSLLIELESAYNVSIPDDQFVAARTGRQLHGLIEKIRRP